MNAIFLNHLILGLTQIHGNGKASTVVHTSGESLNWNQGQQNFGGLAALGAFWGIYSGSLTRLTLLY